MVITEDSLLRHLHITRGMDLHYNFNTFFSKRFAHFPDYNLTIITTVLLLIVCFATSTRAEPVHAIAMHGEPALASDFKHFPYVNPNAPKGGSITYGVVGTFDSVNPFILKSMRTNARGSWDHQFGHLVFESLLFRSRDEPFTMYGLLAEKVEWPNDRSWIEFTLNPRARWSDGVPVTVEDVIFTYELLTAKGRPPYNSRTKKIERIEKTGEHKVKFTFNEQSDREFPLIISLSPILPKHATDFDTFDQSTLKPMIGSGPYTIGKILPGKKITYNRNPDYWAVDLPSRMGFSNFDEVNVEYYRSTSTQFEAFKKGLFDVYPERDPASWKRNFNFPAVDNGEVTKDSFATGRPANMLSFVFNTRRAKFTNKQTREALALLFDFEWANKNLYFGAYERTASFWHGSELSSQGIPANDLEMEILKPYIDQIKPKVLNGTWKPSVSDGSGRDRKILRKAFGLLKKAGYSKQGADLINQSGQKLEFEILTKSESQEKLAIAYRRILSKLGVSVSIRTVDDAQYQQRIQEFDYDMVIQTYRASLSPGIEQTWRWGGVSADTPGSFNFAGTQGPAFDALINHIVKAKTKEEFIAAGACI